MGSAKDPFSTCWDVYLGISTILSKIDKYIILSNIDKYIILSNIDKYMVDAIHFLSVLYKQ